MIQPLRTVHRSAFVALALLLPTILIVGLARRAQETPTHAVQPENSTLTLWHDRIVRSEFEKDSEVPQNVYAILTSERELNEPDLLVYWVTEPVDGSSLPGEAKLLGSFSSGKKFALPPKQNSGSLVLYSLAHRMVLDYATVEKLP